MPRRKTHAEFVAEVEALVGDEYTVLGDYKNTKSKIKIKHNKCNNEYEVRASSFLEGTRCPKCSDNALKTTGIFKQEVFDLVGDEYSVLSEYKGALTKIKMKHNECNHEYEVNPDNFLRGRRCPKCSDNVLKTTGIFKQEVFDLVGDEYSVLGEYKNNRTKIKMKHNKCSHEYMVQPGNFLVGIRCPKCNGNALKTTGIFKQEVFDLVGDEYSVLSEYKGALTKIKMKHNECNHEYEVSPSNFLRGRRCPHCNESKGERKVAESLAKLRIPYIRQHKFEDCRNINRLPFDFSVLNADRTLNCLIEYDGEYHYKPMEHAGGLKSFKVRKRNDAIKTQYCADHNIPLIRIPYWDFDNIDAILTKELRKLGVIETEAIAS